MSEKIEHPFGDTSAFKVSDGLKCENAEYQKAKLAELKRAMGIATAVEEYLRIKNSLF